MNIPIFLFLAISFIWSMVDCGFQHSWMSHRFQIQYNAIIEPFVKVHGEEKLWLIAKLTRERLIYNNDHTELTGFKKDYDHKETDPSAGAANKAVTDYIQRCQNTHAYKACKSDEERKALVLITMSIFVEYLKEYAEKESGIQIVLEQKQKAEKEASEKLEKKKKEADEEAKSRKKELEKEIQKKKTSEDSKANQKIKEIEDEAQRKIAEIEVEANGKKAAVLEEAKRNKSAIEQNAKKDKKSVDLEAARKKQEAEDEAIKRKGQADNEAKKTVQERAALIKTKFSSDDKHTRLAEALYKKFGGPSYFGMGGSSS